MAIGSRRTWPRAPPAAAVVSDPIVAPAYTPEDQLKAWKTSGIVDFRLPPKMIAETGTPSGLSQASRSKLGHCCAGAVKRPLGWAAVCPVSSPILGVHGWPRQSSIFNSGSSTQGGSPVMPSHQTPSGFPSRSVKATLVKMVLRESVAIALGLVVALVPGATPKKPASGLIARSLPSRSGLIQAMSSPTVHTFQPARLSGGIIMAKLVLPHAEGNAAVT